MIRLAKVRACTNLIILSSNVHTVLCEEKGRFCIPVHWTELRNESVPFYLRGPQNHRFEGRGIIARRAIAHDGDNCSTIRCFVFLILGWPSHSSNRSQCRQKVVYWRGQEFSFSSSQSGLHRCFPRSEHSGNAMSRPLPKTSCKNSFTLDLSCAIGGE